MPTLKDLNCSIELSESQHKLQEFGTTYGDGFVETFVPVPSKPQSFSIHLTSDRFIAPGISMYVFVDGVYQCNRNRQDLKLRKGSDSRSVVDLRVRQKEEKQKDGSMIAREWKFEKLDISLADDAPDLCSSNILDNVGCIEVLVLRCAGTRNAKTASAMNMDGTSDFPPPPPFGPDGHSRTPDAQSMYEDRSPQLRGLPTSAYRSPYAETVNSQDGRAQSRYSLHQSNGAPSFSTVPHLRPQSRHAESTHTYAKAPTSIPSVAFQYGSGPIPAGPMMGSERSFYPTRPASLVVANAPDVDKAWLDDLVTKAVQRGVEESRPTQPPGAWPQSPFNPGFPQHNRSQAEKDNGTLWLGSQTGWSEEPEHGQVKPHVTWDSDSGAGGWGAPEETGSETWDSDETWGTKDATKDKESLKSRSKAPTVRSRTVARETSPVTTRRKSQRSRSRPRSSKWSQRQRTPPEDGSGWTHIDIASDSLTDYDDTDDTIQPSHLPNRRWNSRDRSRSQKRSHHTKSNRSKSQRSSRHLRGGTDRPATSVHSHVAPDSHRAAFVTKDASLMMQPHVYPTASGTPAAPEAAPQNGFGPTGVPPPPFSISGGDQKIAWPNNNANKVNWSDQGESGWEPKKTDDNGWSTNNTGWEVKDAVKDKVSSPNEIVGWDTSVPTQGFAKDMEDSWGAQSDNWNSKEEVDKSNDMQWDKETWATAIKPTKASSTSKRHTSKSLSKYRNVRSSSSAGPKHHWQFPPPAPNKPLPSISEPDPLPASPLLKLSSKQASEKRIDHQVRAGKGTHYGHAIARPEYLDTLHHPYAVFRFKYRSRALLKTLLGPAVPLATAHSSGCKMAREKDRLKDVGKDELIEKMVRLKMTMERGKTGRASKRAVSENTESVARGLTERWVKQHSREASEKGK
ncbi:hypothetical protein BDU57DRAFT_421772, partial [Ampelomyces quisqualis]